LLGAARRVVAIGLHRELVGREIDFFEVSYCLFPVGALMVAALWIYLVIMNLAAIAISLPAALVMAPYLGVAPDVVLYVSLTAAGIPFLLLVGAAPNAIAYRSRGPRQPAAAGRDRAVPGLDLGLDGDADPVVIKYSLRDLVISNMILII
jgi:di/tricarboxylate transporter